MTMPRGVSRALYSGNGQAVEFPFLFKVFEEDQLSVHVTSPEGVTTEATGWSAQLDDGGGTLTYLHNGAPLPVGWKLAIVRDMPFEQEVDLITGTRFDPEVIETALDVATAERQQLLERLARAVVVEPTDEAGPQALLADIRAARTSAAASAGNAEAHANAAAESARSAAGSAAIATEEREAACICAGEAQAARDAAVLQAEAANTLMEAELAKVNAIVAANRTDQQAAVTAARQWAEKDPDTPVDYDADGNPRYSARHWAENAQKIAIEPPTAERRGSIRVGAGLRLETGENGETDVLTADLARPDGVTTQADEEGTLSALGGHLLANDEVLITESCTWTAPFDGWYDIRLTNGGNGAYTDAAYLGATVWPGSGAGTKRVLRYYEAGAEIAVTVGAGGLTRRDGTSVGTYGGTTVFDGINGYITSIQGSHFIVTAGGDARALGGGYGAGNGYGSETTWYGAGGGGQNRSSGVVLANGHQGCVRIYFHNPAKAAGEAPAPALLKARKARLPAAQPATINLYDPASGQGSVWRQEDAEAKLAEGLVTQAVWEELCAAKAAEERAAWLADPDTEAERFEMLRRARDARLAATDYLVAADYPLTEERRAAVIAYRQALRDLPAQEGAPWDGGGGATPWPALPALSQGPEANPCA